MCSICKEHFPFGEIRYSGDGKRVICKECYGKAREKPNKTSQSSQLTEKAPAEAVKLICYDCRYKFSFKKGSTARLRCPYCGGDKLVRDDLSAEKLVEEASKGY